jgi:hypothetical protein
MYYNFLSLGLKILTGIYFVLLHLIAVTEVCHLATLSIAEIV